MMNGNTVSLMNRARAMGSYYYARACSYAGFLVFRYYYRRALNITG